MLKVCGDMETCLFLLLGKDKRNFIKIGYIYELY
jgi:hypothetical protein